MENIDEIVAQDFNVTYWKAVLKTEVDYMTEIRENMDKKLEAIGLNANQLDEYLNQFIMIYKVTESYNTAVAEAYMKATEPEPEKKSLFKRLFNK